MIAGIYASSKDIIQQTSYLTFLHHGLTFTISLRSNHDIILNRSTFCSENWTGGPNLVCQKWTGGPVLVA